MATDVKNKSAGDTGASQNKRLTVKANRNTVKHRDPDVEHDYTISKFDAATSGTSDPTDGTNLSTRFDDVSYYV